MGGSGPGRPSGGLGVGGGPRKAETAVCGLPSGFCSGALMLTGPALAQDATVYPDPTLTPGASHTTDREEICSTDTRQLRHGSCARST